MLLLLESLSVGMCFGLVVFFIATIVYYILKSDNKEPYKYKYNCLYCTAPNDNDGRCDYCGKIDS
jgi:hypothetical protein